MQGFTLIELLIVVAVVGILAALVYPSYADNVRRGKIAEALGELSTLRVRLEQYYQDNRNYGSTASTCGVTQPATTSFTFSCAWGSTSSSQSFVATATGTGSMTGFVYTVNDANTQQTTQFYGDTTTSSCWLRKKGDAC
ncbi:MAG: type IV pilin protein [Pseudomonadota bacterium]